VPASPRCWTDSARVCAEFYPDEIDIIDDHHNDYCDVCFENDRLDEYVTPACLYFVQAAPNMIALANCQHLAASQDD
jgi:hypothetical protein